MVAAFSMTAAGNRAVRLGTITIVLTLLAPTIWLGICLSQEVSGEETQPSIDHIASKNKPPKGGGDGPLKLPPNYDFVEQKRIWIEVNRLFDDPESRWAELVAHLDDERYSLTMTSNVSGRRYDWSVGDICHEIVARNLTEAYYGSLKPQSFDRYRTLRTPAFLRPIDVKKWCQDRKDKKFYELQLEVCELTVKALENGDSLQRALSAENRKSCVEIINGAAEELRKTKRPIPYKGFGPEEYSPLIKPRVAIPLAPFPNQR